MTDREFLESRVGQKLRQLRGGLRRRLLGEGLGWVALALVVTVFVTVGLDYSLHLVRPMRALVMGVLMLGVVWIVWQQLIAPLLVPMDNEQLALLVEDRYDDLKDSLISAIQFTRDNRQETPGQSRAMIELVVAQAGKKASGLDFTKVVERSRFIKRITLALCAVALLCAFSLWQTGIMNRWWDRNVLFADTAWPQSIYLEVNGAGDFRVLRGGDLTITVKARASDVSAPKAPPEKITLHTYYESIGVTTESDVELTNKETREYVHVFRGISEPFDFYCTGGDDNRVIKHHVTLIDPPGIGWLRFTVEYPNYMNRPTKMFDDSRAVLAAPPGSLITIHATGDKPVNFQDGATGIFLDGKKVSGLKNDLVKHDGAPTDAKSSFVGLFRLTHPKSGKSKDKSKNKNPMRTLTIKLKDTDGFVNKLAAQYKIRTEPDTAPNLSIRRKYVGAAITPEAIIPLIIQAKDDSGLSEIRTVVGWGTDKPESKSWVLEPGPLGKDRFNTLYERDIKALGFKPGMTIRVMVEADDLMPAELNGPNKGQSGAISFRIVKRDELIAEMVRRQKALRADFELTIRKQEDSISMIEATLMMLNSNKTTEESARNIRDAISMEIGVSGECAKTSAAMSNILMEMVYNRIIETKGRSETLNGIVTPLADLAQRVDALTARMETVEKVTDRENMLKQADEIHSEQQAILEVMQNILERMIKVAEAQELAYKLERLIERWDDVMRAAEAQADWDIQNALGFKCSECTKPLAPEGGPGSKVKCPHCAKTVVKPDLKKSAGD
ncbi:MAG: hypothetical protein GY794_15565 [bacterium]|nr:hypothetical protein [bacterium]